MLENYTRNAYEEIRENTGETLEETQNTDQISNDKIGEFKKGLNVAYSLFLKVSTVLS